MIKSSCSRIARVFFALPLSLAASSLLLASCGKDNSSQPPTDAVPPSAVQDLAVSESAGRRITLRWTAPGDDGSEGRASRYDVRYSAESFFGAAWESAATIPAPVPRDAGAAESLSVPAFPPGVWHFALRAADELPNWSGLSNSVSATVVDTIPPAPVNDLSAGLATMASVDLTWTAPGDDGDAGRASSYDLRRASVPITEENWDDALRVEGLPSPDSAGATERLTVTGLEAGETWYFALRANDASLQRSDLSNVVSRTTARLVRLTSGPNNPPMNGAAKPAWSPDGLTIAFEADWEDGLSSKELHLVPAGGGAVLRLTWDPDFAHSPCWSPEGSRLAFISTRTMNAEIYLMDAVPSAEAVPVTSFQGSRHPTSLAWSPDGAAFAYVSSPFMSGASLYILPRESGVSRLVLTGSRMWGGLAWSPDGARILFVDDRTSNREVFSVPSAGGTAAQLTHDPGDDHSPTWSPDGSRIAFASNRSGSHDIWFMSPDGSKPRQITSGVNACDLAWSPDGKRIAYSGWEEGPGDIWVLVLE